MKRTKPIERYHLRDRDQIPTQIPTWPVTIMEIMASPLFERGVADARSGRGYPPDYDTWEDGEWAYERGRQWATLAPPHVKLKINGKITAAALRLFQEHEGEIL